MNDIECLIFSLGLVPVIKIDHEEDAVPLGQALAAGGLPLAEITFRTPAAAGAVRRLRRELPDLLVGAGTVTSIGQAEEALNAGAAFVVTPGFNRDVVVWCLEHQVPIYPGCITASEVEAAMNLGLSLVKFFPAEQCGGLAKIKALCAPYARMHFMPTGGVGPANLGQYLAFPNVRACGGSFMAPEDRLAARDWAAVTLLCRQALSLAQGFELMHVGLYADSAEAAEELSGRFGHLTSQPVTERGSSFFVGQSLEISKSPKPEWKGQIGYKVNSVDRSRLYLERCGQAFDESTAKRDDAQGSLTSIYLREPLGGFAVHLERKQQTL